MSDHAYVKSGWGSMKNFAESYGEKGPDGYDNAKVILGAMRQDHAGSTAGAWYKGEKAAGREPTMK